MITTQQAKVYDEFRCERAILMPDRVRLCKDGHWFDLIPPKYLAPGVSGLANAAAQRDPLLVERQSTHGSFEHNAMISQELKEIMRNPRPGIQPPSLSVHREALDMIALKLSRILSGQAHYADHWDDIAGYAKLAREACK